VRLQLLHGNFCAVLQFRLKFIAQFKKNEMKESNEAECGI
jgi:hypothetical protein